MPIADLEKHYSLSNCTKRASIGSATWFKKVLCASSLTQMIGMQERLLDYQKQNEYPLKHLLSKEDFIR